MDSPSVGGASSGIAEPSVGGAYRNPVGQAGSGLADEPEVPRSWQRPGDPEL